MMTVSIKELNDPTEAAQEAVKDMNAFISAAQSNSAMPEIGVIGAIGLFSSIAGAVGTVAKTGIDLANLVNGNADGDDTPGSLEILIVNNTQYPAVVYDADTKKSDITDYADPVLPTESTAILITYDDPFKSGDLGDGSSIQFSLMVNDVSVDFVYYFNSDWYFGYKITTDNDFNLFSQDTSLVGGQVTTSDSSSTFDFFSAGIESSNGKVQLNLFSTDWS